VIGIIIRPDRADYSADDLREAMRVLHDANIAVIKAARDGAGHTVVNVPKASGDAALAALNKARIPARRQDS
jgi:hypothetical protein